MTRTIIRCALHKSLFVEEYQKKMHEKSFLHFATSHLGDTTRMFKKTVCVWHAANHPKDEPRQQHNAVRTFFSSVGTKNLVIVRKRM